MSRVVFFLVNLQILFKICNNQVIQFGECADVPTMIYFDLEKFLGRWYEIERFPTWYEDSGQCAYKVVEACGRKIGIEHVFVKYGVEFVLHVNTTYSPGDDAVFVIKESNIDPIGIPLSVIQTDYVNYAIVYGCKNNLSQDLKYISAWILSRERTLPDGILEKAYQELNSIPYANTAYLEQVEQRVEKCQYYWTAHVQAVNSNGDKDADEDDD